MTPGDTEHAVPVAEPVAPPLVALPLEYATAEASRELPRPLRPMAGAAWACVAVTPILMSAISTEIIVGTGAAEAILGVCLAAFAVKRNAPRTVGLGVAHVLLATLVTAWIFFFHVGPSRAHVPVLVIASLATLAGMYPTWAIVRGHWR